MNTVSLETNIDNIELENNEQKNFMQSALGKTINVGLNIGLRYLLPDFIEEQIIEIKDEIINNGFSEGVKKAISSAMDLGKSAIGIVTGNFENINQVQNAIKNGGIIDSVSETINNVVNKLVSNNKLSYSVGNTIKKGKNVILDNISKKIENEFESQLDSIEKLNKYLNNWKEYYKNQDFTGMEKEYNKIEEKIKNVVPIENTLKSVRTLENLHNLIKNNGGNFNLSREELELANIL